MDIRAVFAENLKKHRKAAGLSQEELANIADIERAYVSLLERRLNSPTIDMLAKLAHAIGIEPFELLLPTRKNRK
jgi:transcriptional regulator with XRE-family HTH domain